jgi:hypothetical protein
MAAKLTLLTLSALLCASSYGQQAMSPSLSEFLTAHPEAQTALSNVLCEAQSIRPVHLYYFYASERCHLPTMHRYLDDGSVLGIFVRENEPACDQCIDIIFEALNSKGEKRFMELLDQAKSGGISRQDYVRDIQRQELEAVVAVKQLVSKFRLSTKEASESRSYKEFLESPTEFGKFVAYSRKTSQGQYEKFYEQQYDSLRASRSGGLMPNKNAR